MQQKILTFLLFVSSNGAFSQTKQDTIMNSIFGNPVPIYESGALLDRVKRTLKTR